jgi:hypothetical protein
MTDMVHHKAVERTFVASIVASVAQYIYSAVSGRFEAEDSSMLTKTAKTNSRTSSVMANISITLSHSRALGPQTVALLSKQLRRSDRYHLAMRLSSIRGR